LHGKSLGIDFKYFDTSELHSSLVLLQNNPVRGRRKLDYVIANLTVSRNKEISQGVTLLLLLLLLLWLLLTASGFTPDGSV